MNRAIVYVRSGGGKAALEVEPGSDLESDLNENGELVGLSPPAQAGFYLLAAGSAAEFPGDDSDQDISNWLDHMYPDATWTWVDVEMPSTSW